MALIIALHALSLRGRTDVIMLSAISGRMADIDQHTMDVNANICEPNISHTTALLFCVHSIVNIKTIEKFEALCKKMWIPLLYDSVEAAYESVCGRPIGSFARAETFFMHISKFINGFDGGYVSTNDQKFASEIKRISELGFKAHDIITGPGCNAKFNEMHASMSFVCFMK